MQKKPVVKRNTKGIWCCRLYLGRNINGKPIQPYTSFPDAATESEAQAMAELWAAHLTIDGKVKSTKLVSLLAEYIDIKKNNGASPNTIRQYKTFTKIHIMNYLGTADARELTSSDFTSFEQQLLKDTKSGGEGLSRNTVMCLHQFLRGAYNYFVSAGGICETNPLFNTAKPSREIHEATTLEEWSFTEIDHALTKAAHTFAAWLTLRTGLRCGEVCALRRKDVNRLQSYIHVGGTVIEEPRKEPYRRDVTKGKKCRNVAVTDSDLVMINRYLKLQTAFLTDVSGDTPLITANGPYARPTNVSRSFTHLRRSLNLPANSTFHSLRDTHASWCLANGVDLKTLSERLGHADEATTLRIYAHVLPGRDRAAAETFERVSRTLLDAR